ncbi:uncharacterized protein TNCV_2234931 [Trichonephila clavipes]|nr:uncharacterized protein TNCV_2234931 [Trichonephila clavipes]
MLPFCPNDFDDNNITKIAARAEESRQLARVQRAQDKDRRRYDSKHQMVSYAPGDLVWVYTQNLIVAQPVQWLAMLNVVPWGLGSNPGEGMDFCECILPLQYEVTLKSCRAARPLMRLLEEEERWESPDHPQGFLPLKWGRTEQNRTVACMVLNAKANNMRTNLGLGCDELRGPRSDFVRHDNRNLIICQISSSSTPPSPLSPIKDTKKLKQLVKVHESE